MFFASQKYIDTYGTPRNPDEFAKHRLVMQVADQTAAKESFESFFPAIPERLAGDENKCQQRNYWPSPMAPASACFRHMLRAWGEDCPLEIELRRPFDIWLSYHPGSGRIPRVRRMIDWLVELSIPQIPLVQGRIRHQ